MFCIGSKAGLNVYAGFCGFSRVFGAKNRKHGLACLIGLLPESGPHLIFVTLFAKGMIPISILLASSVVQDGHGMLPMLAHSRREFFIIKATNFSVGLLLGAAAIPCLRFFAPKTREKPQKPA